jgi:hypothetical protein
MLLLPVEQLQRWLEGLAHLAGCHQRPLLPFAFAAPRFPLPAQSARRGRPRVLHSMMSWLRPLLGVRVPEPRWKKP